MEDFDFLDFYDNDDTVEDTDSLEISKDFKVLSEENIVPRKGNFLGLDISQNSSGICIYKDGVKSLYNSSVHYDFGNPFAEVIMRNELKNDLKEIIGDTKLDLVVIEDVFEGSNSEVVRKLYALNTAIDELIVDGEVYCKEFVRVQNVTWKKWLSVVDTNNEFKGLNDKEKIQGYLKIIGIEDSGEGFQDRLDATGLIIGYFLNGSTSKEIIKEKKIKKLNISINDVSCDYAEDMDLATLGATYSRESSVLTLIYDRSLSKKKILDYLSNDIHSIFVTAEPIRLGFLADIFELPILENGGYFSFWLPEKAINKYEKRMEKLNLNESA